MIKRVKLFKSKILSPDKEKENITLINMEIVVDTIKAITIGLTPSRDPFTYLFVINLFMTIAMMIMMINEGKTTPSVEHIAPNIPPTLLPIKVEI